MGNIIRFYNQNRKSIWIFLLIILSLFVLLQLINFFVGEKQEEETNQQREILQNQEDLNNKDSNLQINSNKSAVSGENLGTKGLKDAQKVIEKFLNSCCEQGYEEAYQMLTEECKEEMYPNLEMFINTYAIKIFNGQAISCNMENWTGNTYKVKVMGDILATGKVYESEAIQDYITVERSGNSLKLNINSYIGRKNIKKSNEKDKVKIEILQKDTYMDYEKYTIKVENNSESDILLDSRQDMKSMYIEDGKRVRHSAYTQELTDTDLTIYRNNTRIITIKYYSSYNTNKNIQRLVFSNVIMDYDSNTKIVSNKQTQEIGVNI